MSDTKYSTIQQHEPLRTPSGWSGQEKALIAQLEQIFDDIYRRFGRLKISDLGADLKNMIQDGNATLSVLDSTISAFVEGGLETSALMIDAEGMTITGGRVFIAASQGQQSIMLNEDGAAFSGTNISLVGGNISLAGGKLIIDTGNFTLDEVGNVTIQNASVSGLLQSNGSAVLTKKDIIVSSTEPTELSSGMIWIKPSSGQGGTGSTQVYTQNVNSNSSFSRWASGLSMTGQGGGSASATGPYRYTLKVPYKITINSSALVQRTLVVQMSNGINTLTSSVGLQTTEGLHTAVISITSAGTWLANGSTISLTMSLTAGGGVNPYDYHVVPPGEISLTCAAQGDSGVSAEGWVNAEVQIYQ